VLRNLRQETCSCERMQIQTLLVARYGWAREQRHEHRYPQVICERCGALRSTRSIGRQQFRVARYEAGVIWSHKQKWRADFLRHVQNVGPIESRRFPCGMQDRKSTRLNSSH